MTTATIVEAPPPGLRERSLRGVLWQAIGLGSDRLLRFAANVVLARLLAPGDFGRMGFVLTALMALDALTHVATSEALIHSDRGREHAFQNALFWIAGLRGIVLGVALAAAAPLLARYFRDAQATALFAVAGLFPVLAGFLSPRFAVLEKDLEYRRLALFTIGCATLATAATIALAFFLRSAWALLAGVLLLQGLRTLGSYCLAPFRPALRVSAEHVAEIRRYLWHAAGTPLLITLALQAPALLLGRLQTAAELGVFLLCYRLADLPTSVSLEAVGRVAIPAYSELKSDPVRLRRAWLTALRLVGCLGLPLAVVLGMMGNALPAFVYGAAYEGPPGLFALLAAGGALASLLAVAGPLFWAIGQPAADRRAQLLRCLVLYGLGFWLAAEWSTIGMAAAMAGASLAGGCLALAQVQRVLGVDRRDLGRALLPGTARAVALAAALVIVHLLPGLSPPARLVLDGLVGSAGLALCALHAWKSRGE